MRLISILFPVFMLYLVDLRLLLSLLNMGWLRALDAGLTLPTGIRFFSRCPSLTSTTRTGIKWYSQSLRNTSLPLI